jgi:hypothetical protein
MWHCYTEDRSRARPMLGAELCQDVVLGFSAWRTQRRCYTGLSSLRISKIKTHCAGVYTDVRVREKRFYRARIEVFLVSQGLGLLAW